MIHRIATILKDRIAAFTYVDKIGGLVRVARQNREGREIVIPVAGDVDEAYACDPATIRDMVPDDRYGCIVYFEDRGTTRITERTRGTSYRASLRLVCWINTLKFGSDPTTADRILEQFTNDLNVGQPYNTDTLIGLKHSVEGFPQRGASIFSQYTYPEAERQYLLWPFDAFALDITATYRIKPGCEEAPVPDDDACWTPPVTRKRRNPSEFTCDELLDPVTGLTAAQLGPECLDCGGGGTCDPLTWTLRDEDGNLLEQGSVTDPCGDALPLTAPNASVLRDGAAYGTVLSGGSIDVPSDCPCDPLTVTLAGVEIVNEADPCGVDVDLTCADTVDALVVEGAGTQGANGLYRRTLRGTENHFDKDGEYRVDWETTGGGALPTINDTTGGLVLYVCSTEVFTEGADSLNGLTWDDGYDGASPAPTVRQATIGDICAVPCDPHLFDIQVNVNGVPQTPVANVDPSVNEYA
jgi:hypothetical protein